MKLMCYARAQRSMVQQPVRLQSEHSWRFASAWMLGYVLSGLVTRRWAYQSKTVRAILRSGRCCRSGLLSHDMQILSIKIASGQRQAWYRLVNNQGASLLNGLCGFEERNCFSRQAAKAQRKPLETQQRFAPLREIFFLRYFSCKALGFHR